MFYRKPLLRALGCSEGVWVALNGLEVMGGTTLNAQCHSTGDEHATGKVHFVGSMQVGPNSKPIEWTTASSSIYKGIDCGSVKSLSPVPDK